MHKTITFLFALSFILNGCQKDSITNDTIYLEFPLNISVENIPVGWTLNQHYGYTIHNANIKNIIYNGSIIQGNFNTSISTNEPIRKGQDNNMFKDVFIKANKTTAIKLFEVILRQNLPLYDITCSKNIQWIDLKNDLLFFYSERDSVLIISYLLPYTNDVNIRRNRLNE